jgi:peptide/histidine transporter 3/4
MDNLTSGQVQYEEPTHNDDDDEQRLPVDHEPAASTIDKFNIGFTPVDLRGRPLLDLSNTGGWRAALFIFGNETANNMVATGVFGSMLFYMYYEMHISLPKANVIMNNWLGAHGLLPLFSGFIADAYLGRYYTICIFSVIYVLGLLLSTLTSIVVGLRPLSSGCGVVALYLGTCKQASSTQMFVLYLSLYTIALGVGGVRPCLSTFGADQFDMENPKEKLQLARFFNWYYLAYTLGSVFSATLVVYLYTSVSWAWAFGCLTIAMALANLLFLLGTPLYRHHLPSGSPLTRLLQVLVASTRKCRVQVPDDESLLYEVHDKESAIVGSRRLHHVHDLRYGVLHTFIPVHFLFSTFVLYYTYLDSTW